MDNDRRLADTQPGIATYPQMLPRAIRLHPDTIQSLCQAEQALPPWQPKPIAPLTGIPTVPDPDLPAGAWRIVKLDPQVAVTRVAGRPWWRRRWQWSHVADGMVAYGWAWTHCGGRRRAGRVR